MPLDDSVDWFRFQSTLPRGERRTFIARGKLWQNISIHAPARGATATTYANGWTVIFQSTLPRGERRMSDAPDTPAVVFQSTLPRGERPGYVYTCNKVWHFNPRSREGSDLRKHFFPVSIQHFNPRSREGSDPA